MSMDEHFELLRPASATTFSRGKVDPVAWLRENSNDRHVVSDTSLPLLRSYRMSNRPRAALISLVRNSELEGMMQSMRQLEYRWNRKYQYPWIFFNDEPFSEEFKVGGVQPHEDDI